MAGRRSTFFPRRKRPSRWARSAGVASVPPPVVAHSAGEVRTSETPGSSNASLRNCPRSHAGDVRFQPVAPCRGPAPIGVSGRGRRLEAGPCVAVSPCSSALTNRRDGRGTRSRPTSEDQATRAELYESETRAGIGQRVVPGDFRTSSVRALAWRPCTATVVAHSAGSRSARVRNCPFRSSSRRNDRWQRCLPGQSSDIIQRHRPALKRFSYARHCWQRPGQEVTSRFWEGYWELGILAAGRRYRRLP